MAAEMTAIDLQLQFFTHYHAATHTAQQLNHGGDIMQMRDVANGDRVVCQQCGCQYGQG